MNLANLSIGVASVAILSTPFIAQCDGGDAPPNYGAIIEDRRELPNRAIGSFWGPEGMISVTAYCSKTSGGPIYGAIESGDYYFAGGGTPMNPGRTITANCRAKAPHVVGGYATSWD